MPRKMRQSGVDWIGEIPEGWEVKHVSRLATQVKSKNDGLVEKNLLSLSYGRVIRKPIDTVGGLLAQSFDGYNIIQGDDVVLRLTDLQNDQHSLRVGLARERGIITSAYTTLRPREIGGGTYLYYALGAFDLSKGFYGMGSGVRQGLNYDEVKKIKLPFPPHHTQRKIADYLDSQCNETDGTVTALKTTIEDYKVLKKSLVFEAVTGKNLKGAKVPSGQDWLGEIPAAWDVRRIVNLYREVSERGDDSLPILSVSINTGVSDKELSDEEQERVFIRSEDKSKYKRVQPGDLTYNMMRAWQGAFGAVRVNGMVSPAYVVARPKVEMDSRYVEYLLRSPNATREMQRYSRGIADFRLRLYWPEFKNIRIPCPPLEEQKRIADMLDEKCGEIDAVIADKERLIADLERYKKSLIFEVVTGKREVA